MPTSNIEPTSTSSREEPLRIELTQNQFRTVVEELHSTPSTSALEIWNKRLDILQKIVITLGVGLFSTYIAWQEFSTKKSESHANHFAGLFAKEEATRLEAAAAAANDLNGKELENFVRLALGRFSDSSPLIREYAENAVVNMALTSYEVDKKALIVNVMAEGLGGDQDQDTKSRAAEAIGRIGLSTSRLLIAMATALKNREEDQQVLGDICNAVRNLKWNSTSLQTLAADISGLRQDLANIGHDTHRPRDLQIECTRAEQVLANK